jgi:hypothetical protein
MNKNPKIYKLKRENKYKFSVTNNLNLKLKKYSLIKIKFIKKNAKYH